MLISDKDCAGFLRLVAIVALTGLALSYVTGCSLLDPDSRNLNRDFWERKERWGP